MEIIDQLRQLVDSAMISLEDIHKVNFKPHPFMIGVKHVSYAAEHNGGMLTQDIIDKIPCAQKGCNLSSKEHTCDTVLFVKLAKNLTEVELRNELLKLKDSMIANSIDGVAFIESDYKLIKDDTAESDAVGNEESE